MHPRLWPSTAKKSTSESKAKAKPAASPTNPPNTDPELFLYLDPAGQYPCRLRSNAERPRRDARVAEGAPLLREYRAKHLIEGSNPSLSARYAKRPARGVLRIWRREVVDEPTVRQIRLERIWTAAGWPWSA